MPGPGRFKTIIMDKAPSGDQLTMQGDLGYTTADYTVLANTFNAEFGTAVTAADLEGFSTVNDVVVYMEGL
jgi:hypothetical protein